MRAVVTRVSRASVSVSGRMVGAIKRGFLILLGVRTDDTEDVAVKMAEKICNLRIFADENGKMNLDLRSAGGELLIVSNFTLYADTGSRRPGFMNAARPDFANPLFKRVVSECKIRGIHVETGEFGAEMDVESINDGPVTIIMEVPALSE